jgi:hypothetical protein
MVAIIFPLPNLFFGVETIGGKSGGVVWGSGVTGRGGEVGEFLGVGTVMKSGRGGRSVC